MTPFKYFWICSSIILVSGCAGFQTNHYSFSTQKNDFMAEYCQSSKQKKALKTTVIYFTPDLEKGISLDKANKKNKELSEQKNMFLKKLFYLLGDSDMSEKIANHGDLPKWYSLTSNDETDVIKNMKGEDSSTKFQLFTFVVKILNKNKIIIYQSNLDSRRMNYGKGYATDLNDLFSKYTLLAPKEVIEEITESKFDSRFPYSSIILNEDGEVSLSKSINNKDRLWETYINKFTTIKETSEDNSKKSTAELSLDLNIFCKYGREVSDILSKQTNLR